jgi:tetratricopeptide (TPR) repeat protein
VAYAEALQITLSDGEKRQIWKAALPTRSLRALEFYTRGQIALDRGAKVDAVDLLVRAIENDVRFAMAQYTLGRVYASLGSRWKAAAQYRAVTLLDRTMPEPYKALGDLFLVQPRRLVNPAIEAYSWAINLRPFYAGAHVGLGNARLEKGDVEAAVIAYEQAARLDPFQAQPHLRLGEVFSSTGRCADALIAYSRAFELDPRSTETRAGVDAMAGGRCIPVGL